MTRKRNAPKDNSEELTTEEIKKIYKEYYSNQRAVLAGETYRSQRPSSWRRKPRQLPER